MEINTANNSQKKQFLVLWSAHPQRMESPLVKKTEDYRDKPNTHAICCREPKDRTTVNMLILPSGDNQNQWSVEEKS